MNISLVSIIVINWNGENIIKKCLPSLLNLDYPNYEIIFVDNNSNDKSIQYVEEQRGKSKMPFRIIKNKNNYGNAKGKNIGAKYASGKYLWLLDNDIKVKSNSLNYLVEYLEKNKEAGILSPKLLNFQDPSRILSAGGLFTFYGPSINNLGFNKLDNGDYNYEREISFATGAVTFLSKKLWDKMGGYQTRGNSFCHEDCDIGARCRIFGYKIFYIPQSITFHYGESGILHSGRSKQYYRKRFVSYIYDMLRTIIKNFKFKNISIIFPCYFIFSLLKALKNIFIKRDLFLLISWLKGYYIFGINIKDIYSQRKLLQKNRILNDKIFWIKPKNKIKAL